MPPRYNTTTHRGGWSTSICDLFAQPQRRSNCCAFACFGLLLSDRNAHLMLQEVRPSWWKRFCWNIGTPVMVLLILNVLQTFLATDDTLHLWQIATWCTLLIMIAFLLYRARFERMQVRRAIMKKMFEKRHGVNPDESDIIADAATNGTTPDAYLQLHAHDIRIAHATCCCFPKDVIYNYSTVPGTEQQRLQQDEETEGQAGLVQRAAPKRDLCSCLWNTIRSLCCGACCSCWIQCCGMCAIGQEDREIENLLDKKQLQVDYITFQPYSDYYPQILALRNAGDGRLSHHWRALSLLSYNLVKILAFCLAVLTFVALLQVDPKFQIQNLIVVVATFGQAFLILWLCHWQWNKFDLSMDALVKYFASGFCLCTFLAMVYELLISSVFGMLSYIVVVVGTAQDVAAAASPEEVEEAAADFSKSHVGIFSIFVFLNAFVVAALVEELSKYFGYFMVETPDLMDPDELVLESSSGGSVTDESPKRSLVSQGAGVTVAMVAVAAGFACSENLLYVFLYTPPGLTNEIATLVARSMFPIHPLCAAIQSIGIVGRDVEKNPKWQLGRSIFLAVLLHGTFDFVLMLLSLLESSSSNEASSSGEEEAADDATIQEFDQADALPLIINLSLVVVGVMYYCCAGQGQRKRLEEMDQGRQGGDDNLVV